MSGFYPTRNFGHFWAALSKMSLNFSKFLGRLRPRTQCPYTQCPLSIVSSSVSSSCLLLWPWLRSLSHGGLVRCMLCSVWHGCLHQWSLDSLSYQHRTVKKTKKTKLRRKPNLTEINNKGRHWGDKQHSPCFFGGFHQKNTAYARLGV